MEILISKICNIVFGSYDSKYIMSVVSINATVLSILIGLGSAYVLHINSQINSLETETLNIAHEVNSIQFSPIWFGLVTPSSKFIGNWTSTEKQISNWLAPFYAMPKGGVTDDIAKSPPFKVYLNNFGLNLTEIKLCMIGSLALKSPFPDRMIMEGKRASGWIPNPNKIFHSIKDVENWIKEIEEKFKFIVDSIKWFGKEVFLSEFDWNGIERFRIKFDDKMNILKQEAINEYKKIPIEFTDNVIKIYKISNSLKPKIDRINYLKQLSPSKFSTYFLLIFAILAFIIGIIFPIISPETNKNFIVWFPVLFYIIFLGFLSVKIFRNLI